MHRRKYPDYYVVTCEMEDKSITYEVAHKEGEIVCEHIKDEEAAKCIAMLCCLNYLTFNQDGELIINVDMDNNLVDDEDSDIDSPTDNLTITQDDEDAYREIDWDSIKMSKPVVAGE